MGSRTSPSGRGAGAGVDSAWEQKKLAAGKTLENAAREAPQRPVHTLALGQCQGHPRARAGRFISRFFVKDKSWLFMFAV